MKFFKSLTQSARTSDAGSHLPPDRLQATHLAAGGECVQAQSGIPSTADCCAYEPIQRLFAVSTSDGRVRIIGTEGVERTLQSAARLPQATKQLAFLYNRGVILRVCEGGNVELWSTDHLSAHDQGLPLCTLTVKGDAVTVAAPMQRDPYLLLGCASGCVRVAALTNASGSTVTEARQVRNLKLLPYKIEAMQLDSEGEVVQLMTQSEPPVHRFLSVHAQSGAALWDMRAQELVAVVSHRNSKTAATARDSGHTTAACWLTRSARGDFATGHASGDIIVWALPGPDDLQPRVLAQLRVAAAPGLPVRSLQYVSGRSESLLVFGGQGEDQPDGLVLLPLPEPMLDPEAALGMDEEALEAQLAQRNAQPPARPKKLPWFGAVCAHALVPAPGAITGFEDPVAVLVLMEAGELVVHDLGSGAAAGAGIAGTAAAASPGGGKSAAAAAALAAAPQHFRHALQASPLVTAARLRIIPVGRVPLQGLQGASMTGLREWAAVRRAHEKEWTTPTYGPPATAWQWIAGGGRPAKPDTNAATAVLYCTGHVDGSVRLWDMYGETPMLLGSVPSVAASKALGRAAAAKAVSTIEFAWEQGLLISGHEGGELRVYQFGEHQRRINCVRFESVGAFGGDNAAVAIDEPQGFQLRLVTLIHSADICNSAYDPSSKAVAVSDSAGSVSLIDLSKPSVAWFQAPFARPVVSLSLAQVPLPSSSHRSEALAASLGGLPAGEAVRGVVAVSEDSCLGLLDAATGFLMSREGALKPKNHSTALHVELLDASGAPLWMARSVNELLDACRSSSNNNAGTSTTTPTAAAAAAARRGAPGTPTQRSAAAPAAQAPAGCSDDEEAGDADLGGGFSAQDLLPYKAGSRGQRATVDSVASADSFGSEAAGARGEEGGEEAGSDEDVDALLARAAAQVEAEDKKGRKRASKPKPSTPSSTHHPRSPTKSSSTNADKPRSPSRGRGSPSPDHRASARSPAHDNSTSLHRTKSKLSGLSTSRSNGSLAGEGSDGAASPQRSSTNAAAGRSTSSAAPITLADPEAAFVLVATKEFLRLYTISHIASADRTTAKRVTLTGPLHFASAFVTNGAPALVCLLSVGGDAQLQVFSLPGLEQRLDVPLSSLTGWRWEWNPRTVSRLSQVCACTRGGQLALLGPGQELLRLGLAAGDLPPQQAESSYDWDLAAAAHSAATAFERARALGATLGRGKSAKPQRPGQGASDMDEAAAAAVAAVAAAEAAQREQQDSGQRRPKDFIGFMSRIGQDLNKAGTDVAKGLQKAIDETHKGMQKVAQVFEEDLPALLAAPAKPMSAEAAYRHPELSVIFGGNDTRADGANSPSERRAAAGSTGRTQAAGSAAAVGASGRLGGVGSGPVPAAYAGGAVGSRQQGVGMRSPGGNGWPGGASEDVSRSELFATTSSSPSTLPSHATHTRPSAATSSAHAGARSPGAASSSAAASGKTAVRSADEIRAAYGRAPVARANEVAGVMAENRQKLVERGEKLRALEDKTSDLEESASGFAEMAKQLAERERNRSKWF